MIVRAGVVGFNLNPVLTLCLFDGLSEGGICTYGHCGDDVINALIDEVVYFSMPLEESRNIFQSVLAIQSCSVASASSDQFRFERVTGTSCLSFCL
jgi:hypothetical protein